MKSIRQGKVWFWLRQRPQNHAQNSQNVMICSQSCCFRSKCIVLDMILRPLSQPNYTFLHRMCFIFHELLEENSTASSWNMKSVRQRKVLIWEKTLWKKWNPVCTIYCRGSYSNSQDRAFGANTISRIIRKIVNFIRKSRMWGILISKPPKKSCFPCSNWCYHQLQMSPCAMDFAH